MPKIPPLALCLLVAALITPAKAPAEPGQASEYWLRLASFRQESELDSGRAKLIARHGPVLAGLVFYDVPADLGEGKGVFHRLVVGPFDHTKAETLAKTLADAGQASLLTDDPSRVEEPTTALRPAVKHLAEKPAPAASPKTSPKPEPKIAAPKDSPAAGQTTVGDVDPKPTAAELAEGRARSDQPLHPVDLALAEARQNTAPKIDKKSPQKPADEGKPQKPVQNAPVGTAQTAPAKTSPHAPSKNALRELSQAPSYKISPANTLNPEIVDAAPKDPPAIQNDTTLVKTPTLSLQSVNSNHLYQTSLVDSPLKRDIGEDNHAFAGLKLGLGPLSLTPGAAVDRAGDVKPYAGVGIQF